MVEFARAVKDAEEKCSVLLASPLCTLDTLPDNMPLKAKGVYILSENGQPLYVGRTNNLRKRLQDHTRNNHHQATFAFLLAREETGKTKPACRPSGSRSDLLNDPLFHLAFDRARERIRRMNIQFIEETDPVRQALLEICAALRAHARYNHFDNH